MPWNEVIRKMPKRPISELSLAEEAQLEVLEWPEVMAVHHFKLTSGLRIAPIINLTWPQIDFVNETVTVIEKGRKPVTKPMDSEMQAIPWELWTELHHETHVFSYIARRTRIELESGRQLSNYPPAVPGALSF
jgi:integrase